MYRGKKKKNKKMTKGSNIAKKPRFVNDISLQQKFVFQHQVAAKICVPAQK